MSKRARICFDASVKEDGVVGIGVYDDSNNIKLHKSYNTNLTPAQSYKAEFIGMVTAMEYAFTNDLKNPNLFTDNQLLAKKGIPDYLIEKYGFAKLYWIPREFNKTADHLSKSSKNVSDPVTVEYIDSFNPNKRKKLLKLLTINDFRKKMLKYFCNCDLLEFKRMVKNYRKSDHVFMYLLKESEAYKMGTNIKEKNVILKNRLPKKPPAIEKIIEHISKDAKLKN